MKMYRIREWDAHYENNRTRGMKSLGWVPIPVNLSGDGYTMIMEQKDGPSIFGAFVALVEVAAQCSPRGTLVRSSGDPHDPASISRLTRIDVKTINRMLAFCTDNCKWIEIIGMQDGAVKAQEGAERVPSLELNRTEMNRTETRETENMSSSIPSSEDPNPKEKKIHYAEHVTMTEEQHGKLREKYSKRFVDKCIEVLDNYKGSRGKKYKSDYHTIRNWVIDRVFKEFGKLPDPHQKQYDEELPDDPGEIATPAETAEFMKNLTSNIGRRIE